MAYGAATGSDFATGIGSVNVYNLIQRLAAITPQPDGYLGRRESGALFSFMWEEKLPLTFPDHGPPWLCIHDGPYLSNDSNHSSADSGARSIRKTVVPTPNF
jgi:hypothetical protein